MLKLIFLAILSTAVAEDGKSHLYSLHAPEHTPGYLNLTTGELKVFSGHAMNIIRTKCPAVDSEKIFQVTKYIGKLIAKTEPVPGASKDFKNLLDTMTTCEKEGVVPKPEPERSSVFRTFFYPFRHMKTILLNHPNPEDETVEPVPIVESGVDSGLVQKDGEPKKGEAVVPTTESSDFPARKIVKATIFVRPQDMQEGIRTSGGFFNWIHSIFSKIGGFFGHIFPFGHPVRKRRDISEVSAADSIIDLPEDSQQASKSDFQVFTPTKDDSKGKRSFGQLIDHMCRLYCDNCSGEKDIMNFKRAARELLTFLFKEDSGIELAAKKFLDPEFLQSIEACH